MQLWQGLFIADGLALAARLDNKVYRVYALLGDGECDEGQVWEAAILASHYKLDNLTAIVDRNGLQIDGPTEKKIKSPLNFFRRTTTTTTFCALKDVSFEVEEGEVVGGHCLPVDPYYLVKKAEELGYHSKVITAERAINDYMRACGGSERVLLRFLWRSLRRGVPAFA